MLLGYISFDVSFGEWEGEATLAIYEGQPIDETAIELRVRSALAQSGHRPERLSIVQTAKTF